MYGRTTKFLQSNYKSLLALQEEKPTQLESNPQLTSTRESPRLTTKIRQSKKNKTKNSIYLLSEIQIKLGFLYFICLAALFA